MAGFDNETVYGSNVDFSGSAIVNPTILTNGQLIIGSTALNVGGTHINIGVLTSPSGTVTIGYSSPNITLDVISETTPVLSFNVDASTPPGTDPVLPTVGGQVTVTGAQVAAGTVGANIIRTNSVAASTWTTEIQRSTATASSTVASNGVCHFDSSFFAVDSNAFVSATGVTPNPSNTIWFYDDFLNCGGSQEADTNWATNSNGSITSEHNHPGIRGQSGVLVLYKNAGADAGNFFVGDGYIEYNIILKALSMGASGFIDAGIFNKTASLPAWGTDAIEFRATNGVNSNQWQCICRSASTATIVNTTTAAVGTWYKLTIQVNLAGTSVNFLINDVVVPGTPITTNIPLTTVGVNFGQEQGSNTVVGIDFISLLINLSSNRY